MSFRRLFDQFLSLFLCAILLSQGACGGTALGAIPGWAEYLALSFVRVPGGFVNAAGGNLLIQRTAMSIDTLLGTQDFGETYNSGLGRWVWKHQISYDGSLLIDSSGIQISLDGVADGDEVPGTAWVKVNSTRLRTKGGMLYTFDVDGRISHQHWATLDYPRIRYVFSSDRLVVEQCTSASLCTSFFDVSLRPDGRPISVVDTRTGRIAIYEYTDDDLTRALTAQETEAGLQGTTFEYNAGGTLLLAMTNSEGERIEYAYVGKKVTKIVQLGEGNPTHTFSYGVKQDGAGGLFPTTYTNPLGGKVAMLFDSEQKLREQEYIATGDRRLVDWNDGRRVVRDRLPSGATTNFDYTVDDATTITLPSGNVLQVVYEPGALNLQDPLSRPIRRVEDSLGVVFANSFDAEGRIEVNTNGAGEVRSLAYGFSAFLDSYTNPSGITTTFSLYGVHGHWLESEGLQADTRSFDEVGNALIRTVNGRSGGRLFRDFDAARNVVAWNAAATTDGLVAETGTVALSRRSDGQPLYLSRPGGGDHQFQYDSIGRPSVRSEFVDGVWHDATFEYDAAGNMTAMELANGMRQELEYDVYGRLTRHRAFRDGMLEGERVLGYRTAQLETSWDSIRGTTEVYGYDYAGRLISIDFGNGDSVSRGFDGRSRLISETWSFGAQVLADVGYEYDLTGRVVSLNDRMTGESLVQVDYQAGKPVALQYANGLIRTLFYDSGTGRATGAETWTATDELIATSTLEWTTEPNPDRTQIRLDVGTSLATTSETYWLTRSDQVSEAGSRVFQWSNDASDTREFSYDVLGNRVDAGGDTFIYNAEGNRLEAATIDGRTIAYEYDAAGFATMRDGVDITWTAMGRMSSFGSDRAVWDMSGRLLELEVGGVVRRFDLFGGAIESDAATGFLGTLDLRHVAIDISTGERVYRHFDFRGNVSFVTDAAGTVVSHYRYRPYGMDTAFGVEGGVHFVSKAAVGELMLLGARVYDAETGRFLSPDPILQPMNQYSYTNGNPVFFLDASGLIEAVQLAQFMVAIALAIVIAGAALAALPAAAVITISGVSLEVIGSAAVIAGASGTLAVGVGFIVSEAIDGLVEIGGSSGGHGGGGGGGGGPGGGGPKKSGPGTIPDQIKVLELPVGPPPPPAPCSPTELSRTPNAAGWLPWLLAINALLGAMLLRSRKTYRVSRAGS